MTAHQKEIAIFLTALRRISQHDAQSDMCGPFAPERCAIGCIGCIAREAILESARVPRD